MKCDYWWNSDGCASPHRCILPEDHDEPHRCGCGSTRGENFAASEPVPIIREIVKPENETMQRQLFQIAILQDTPVEGSTDGETDTTEILPLQTVLAVGAQSAYDQAIRLLPPNADLDRIRVFVVQLQSNIPARW